MPTNPTEKPKSTNPSRPQTQNSLNIYQHNCCGSNPVFISFFSIIKSKNPDIIAVQDPFLWNSKLLSAPSFTLIYENSFPKPKVTTYINNNLLKHAEYISAPPSSPYIQTITIHLPNNNPIVIRNIYNTPWNANEIETFTIFVNSHIPTIVLGEFNLHSPSSDPLRLFNRREIWASTPYFDTAAARRHALHTTHEPTFTNNAFSKYRATWDNDPPPTGSDHSAPHTTIHLNYPLPPTTQPD